MIIRQANVKDIEQLTDLFEAYRLWYRMGPNRQDAYSFLLNRLEKEESQIFVAEDDQSLVGFVQLYPIFSSTRLKRMWLLNDLFVKEEYRNQSLGKKLMDRSKKLARDTNAAGLLLETEVSNDVGNHLYPSMGFHLEKNNFYFWPNT